VIFDSGDRGHVCSVLIARKASFLVTAVSRKWRASAKGYEYVTRHCTSLCGTVHLVASVRALVLICAAELTAFGSAGIVRASQPQGPRPSSKSAICDELLSHEVKFFAYSFMHALPPFELRYRPVERLEASDGMAKIDLDNDGMLLNVVRLTSPYCNSGSLLAVVDDTRTRIPDSPINHVLLSDLTSQGSCGFDVNAFSRLGTTYIDVDGLGDHTVYEIRQGQASVVCAVNTFDPTE
jgi:hypothetical protein